MWNNVFLIRFCEEMFRSIKKEIINERFYRKYRLVWSVCVPTIPTLDRFYCFYVYRGCLE